MNINLWISFFLFLSSFKSRIITPQVGAKLVLLSIFSQLFFLKPTPLDIKRLWYATCYQLFSQCKCCGLMLLLFSILFALKLIVSEYGNYIIMTLKQNKIVQLRINFNGHQEKLLQAIIVHLINLLYLILTGYFFFQLGDIFFLFFNLQKHFRPLHCNNIPYRQPIAVWQGFKLHEYSFVD